MLRSSEISVIKTRLKFLRFCSCGAAQGDMGLYGLPENMLIMHCEVAISSKERDEFVDCQKTIRLRLLPPDNRTL